MTFSPYLATGRMPIAAALSALTIAGCVKASAPSTMKPPSEVEATSSLVVEVSPLQPRNELPESAREMLRERMIRHGEEMFYLVSGVLLLEYETVEHLANRLAKEPKLGRPAKGETDTLNALLPSAFFDHQDSMAEHARGLGVAARTHDGDQLVEAFSALTKSCVGCHSSYLEDDLGFPGHGDEPDDLENDNLCEFGEPCSGANVAPVREGR